MEKYFFEAFENMERLGPGSEEGTLKGASYIDKNRPVKILDIGCGVGTHTFLLGKNIENAEIIAIDSNEDYIKILNKKAKELDLDHRIKGICMSMFQMDFENETFDYIFAEGSIYIAGFTEGLKLWKPLLKKGGVLICSEISWLVENPSDIPKRYWEEGYAQMGTVTNKISQSKNLEYDLVDYFPLPKEAWRENYYIPLEKSINLMGKRYKDNKEVLSVINMLKEEIDMYNKYGNEYTYVFYILRKA